jgi:hypothetical protein
MKPRQAASSAGESAWATGVVVVANVARTDCVCNDGSSARGDRQWVRPDERRMSGQLRSQR